MSVTLPLPPPVAKLFLVFWLNIPSKISFIKSKYHPNLTDEHLASLGDQPSEILLLAAQNLHMQWMLVPMHPLPEGGITCKNTGYTNLEEHTVHIAVSLAIQQNRGLAEMYHYLITTIHWKKCFDILTTTIRKCTSWATIITRGMSTVGRETKSAPHLGWFLCLEYPTFIVL